MAYLLFIIGLVLLIKGAHWLVLAGTALAKKYGVSEMMIGLTVVSFGTSLPELIVNLIASFNGNTGIAIGNVMGSNVANILLILGAASLLNPLPLKRATIVSEIPFSIIAALLVGFLANAAFLPGEASQELSRLDGGIFLLFFALFMFYVISVSIENQNDAHGGGTREDLMPGKKITLFFLAGVIGLFFGGMWTVDGAVALANRLGRSESFVGLTIVAVGTSLPELVTSMIAAFRRQTDIAVGNVVGSNIFNILWILGLSSLIRPLPFQKINNLDIMVILLSSLLMLTLVPQSRRMALLRGHGLLFLVIYIVYIYYLMQRG